MTEQDYRERAAEVWAAWRDSRHPSDLNLVDAITSLCLQVAKESAPRWIPVSERLPEQEGHRFLCASSYDLPRVYWHYAGKFYYTTGDAMDGRADLSVTHWQDIAPPTPRR